MVVAVNVYNVDRLRESGWDEVRRTSADKWLDCDTMRAIVMPAFGRALIVARREMRPSDVLISPEGAFRFFFPGRVEQSYPLVCDQLRRFASSR